MQNEGENSVCRLCLISCEYNYEDVEATTVEILRSLGLELDLNRGKPVFCKICSESVRKCFDFKTVCLCTEDCINLFRSNESNVKVDLREIYLQKNVNEIVFGSECHTICRLCMEVAESGCYSALNVEGKDVTSAKTILGKFFSEIDLDITENPIICTTCNESLHSYFSFIKNCLDMADKIKKYCKSEGSSSIPQVESNYVLQIKTEDKLNYENDYAGRDVQKNWRENELYDENKLKFEHLVQNESQKLHIKHEFNGNEEVDDDEVEKLGSSLQFTTANVLYCKNDYIDTNIVKKLHENEAKVETELKCKSFVKAESHEFNVKNEEIDIKAEDEDTARFQDDVLIPKDAAVIPTYQSNESTFKTRCNNDLTQHMLIHKSPSEVAAYSCGTYTYETNQKGHLNEHTLLHKSISEVTMYSCGICSFKTKYKGSLKIHMLIHKNSSQITMYSCEKCTYKTKFKNHLKQHMLVHKDTFEVTTYSCEICTYKTKRKRSLKVHMLIHKNASEVTMYLCEVCTFKTKRKHSLTKHMLIHKNDSEVTMYSCEVCTYKTKLKETLKQHMLIHTDVFEITTYPCEICTYKTKRKRSLNQHMLVHKNASEVTMYACEICAFKTKRKHGLKKHMSIHKNVAKIATHSYEESTSYPLHTPPVVVPLYIPPIVVYIN